MSEVTLENPGFDLPEKPNNTGLLPTTHKAVAWVAENIRWRSGSVIYRPGLAIDFGGGNCFAQAIAGAAIIHAWGLDAGIVYDGHHAHFLAGNGEQVVFGDPWWKTVRKPYQEITDRGGHNELAELYIKHLPSDLASGRFARYFYEDHISADTGRWVSEGFETFDPGPTVSIHSGSPHVIIDAEQGIAMLLAKGDLERYFKTVSDINPKFFEKYDALSKMLPYFASIPKPARV